MNAPVVARPVTAAETSVGCVAYRRLHLPTSVEFTGDEERPAYGERLEALLLRAVARAIKQDDRDAGITGTRPGWPPAGDETAAGAPTESTPSGRAHLTFAMAVVEADEGEEQGRAGGAEEEGREGESGAGQSTGRAAQGQSHMEAAQKTPEPSAPPAAGTQQTTGKAAAPRKPTSATATPAAAGSPTAPTAEQTPAPPAAPAIATEVSPQEAATEAPYGTRDVAAAAGEESVDVSVVTEPRSEVIEGPSPVDGRAVMVIGATQLVMLGEATRHARTESLIHAVQLGDHIFGALSFAVLEGPLGTAESFYWAVATSPTVTDEIVGKAVGVGHLAGEKVDLYSGFHVLRVVTTPDGHRYGVNLLWTKERGWVWGSQEEGERWLQLSKFYQELGLSAEELQALAFRELDHLVDAGLAGNDESLEKAAAQLSEMNARAFALASVERREKYLEILVKAWTFEEPRHAIMQIMLSLDGMTQLQAVRDRLIKAGLYEQLFADLGSDLWDLLMEVGKKFGDHRELTVREFIGLVAEALNLTMRHDVGLSRNVEQEQTAVVDLKKMIEIEEAVRAAMGFVLGTLEAVKIMLTQPEKILSALWELNKLTVTCYLAWYGHEASTKQLKALVQQVGSAVGGALVNGLRGAALLGVGPRALTRIKWAVIIEALTWMTEIQAAVEALAKIEKVVAILRFLKVLKVFEGEQIAARFTRLAEALHGGSAVLNGLKDEHAVVDLMVMLPEEDGIRLGAVLQEIDVPKGSRLAELMEHPRLGPVLADLKPKAEVLRVLGAKSGGLTPEVAQMFTRLTGKDAFTVAEVAKVAEALQEGEGARFAAMLEQIGYGRIRAGDQVKADLLAMLAADGKRMEAVHQYGITVVGQMHSRSAGSAEAFDAMLARLEKIRAQHLAEGKAVEFSEFVEKLNQAKKGPWRRLDGPLKAPPVKATVLERAPVRQRIKELRERFPKNKVKNPKAMDNALRQIARTAETDPAKAMESLEKFEELVKAQGRTEGHVADIVAEAEAKASKEAKALHHEAEEAPAQALSAREELKPKLGEAGSPSHELTRSMERIGQHKPYGHSAHHGVPASDRRAQPARDILEWAGVNPDDCPLNGIYLTQTSMDPKVIHEAGSLHQVLHTDNYYKAITQRLVEARKYGGADGVIHEMSRIKEDLIHGWHPPAAEGTGGENFAQWFERYVHENVDWLTPAEQAELLERVRATPRRPSAPRAPRKASPREAAGAAAAPKPQPPETAKAKPRAEAGPRTEAKPKAETEPKAEAKRKAEHEAKLKAEAEPKPKTEAKAKAKSEAQAKAKAKAKAKSEAKAKAKSEAKVKAKAQTKSEAKAKAEAKAKSEAKVKAKAKAKSEPQPETAAKPKPAAEPGTASASEPGTATTASEREPPAEPAVRQRIAVEPPPPGPRVSVEPPPRKRRGPKPRVRVDTQPPTRVAPEVAEDVAGEPLYEVVGEVSEPERKQKRAHRQGGHGK